MKTDNVYTKNQIISMFNNFVNGDVNDGAPTVAYEWNYQLQTLSAWDSNDELKNTINHWESQGFKRTPEKDIVFEYHGLKFEIIVLTHKSITIPFDPVALYIGGYLKSDNETLIIKNLNDYKFLKRNYQLNKLTTLK
jgi:hypothetical protein